MITPDKKSADQTAGSGTPQSNPQTDKAANVAAHEQADRDIDADPDFSNSSPNDDLDEGETARLGEDGTALI